MRIRTVFCATVLATVAALPLAGVASAQPQPTDRDCRDFASQAAAQSALGTITSAIATVASRRGTLGSVQSRLNTAIANLQIARENFSAAESRIRDADVAEETATLTRTTILQQAGVSVLAQANQQPSLALSLLR